MLLVCCWVPQRRPSFLLNRGVCVCVESYNVAAWRARGERRSQWQDIVDNLPVEQDVGLLRIQCLALQRRLAERAERLASTLLLALQVRPWGRRRGRDTCGAELGACLFQRA